MSEFSQFNGDAQQSSDYTNLSGTDLLRNRDFLNDLERMMSLEGKTYSTTQEMLDDWYTDNRWKDSNTVSAALDMIDYANAGSDQALMARLSKAWQNAPSRGGIAEKVWDYGVASIADPINFIPYAGAASKAANVAKAARLAGSTSKQAVGAAMKAGALRGAAIEGVAGGLAGVGMEGVQQSRQIQQGLRDNYDFGQMAATGAIEGAFSAAIGAPVGALASRKPALEALSWGKSKLAIEIETQLADLTRLEDEMRVVLADPSRAIDHGPARADLALVAEERARIHAHVDTVNNLNAEADDLAKKMAVEGADVPALKKQFDEKLKAFNDAISTEEIPDIVTHQGPMPQTQTPTAGSVSGKAAAGSATPNQTPTAAPAAGSATPNQTPNQTPPAAAVGSTPTEAAPTTTAAPAEAAPATTEAPAKAADTTPAAEPAQADTTPAGDATEAPAEPAGPPAIMEIPKAKPVKFSMSDAQKKSFDKGWGKDGATHKNKAAKAGNEPLTKSDLEKIVGSVENGVNKEGKLTRNGMKAIREFQANREGRAMKTTARRPDDASFTDPNVSTQRVAAEGEAKSAAIAAETDAISEEANGVFSDILRKAEGNHSRINQIFRGIAGEMTEEGAAAVRRRIKDFNDNVRPVLEKINRAERASAMKVEMTRMDARMSADDAKYTASRLADRTDNAGKALATDKTAGRVYRTHVDPKTGETKVSSKISRLFKTGTDLGDGYTITEGEGIFRRANETVEKAKAQAELDFSQGKVKAVYPFPARAGLQVIGIPGVGRGRMGVAEEGQQVFGAMMPTKKGGQPIFKVFASEKMALERLGLKRAEDIGVDTSKIKPLKSMEEYEAALDDAYEAFAKTGDEAALDETIAVTKAAAREGDLSIDPPDAPVVKDGRGNVVDTDVPDLPLAKDGKILVLLPKTTEINVIIPGQSQIADGKTVKDLLGKKPAAMFNFGYVPSVINGKPAHTYKANRRAIRNAFEPAEAKYAFDFKPEPEVDLPPRPFDYTETSDVLIDIPTLASSEEGRVLADRLYDGSNLVYGGSESALAKTREDFLNGRVSIQQLSDVLNKLEREEFRLTMQLGSAGEREIPVSYRLNAINAYYTVLAKEAPLGIKKPATDINSSIASLNKAISGVGPKIAGTIERLFREVVPTDNAPIFLSTKEALGADVSGSMFSYDQKSSWFNKIAIDKKTLDKDGTRTGITASYTVMHELGHWAYENLLPYDLKRDFWEAVSKFYDETGRFNEGGEIGNGSATLLDRFTPAVALDGKMAGIENGKMNPQEFFANQFSLYMHHKFEAPLATKNESVLKRAAAVIQKLWMHLTGRHIIDPDMEQIFDKLIANKDEARRVQFTFPVTEPATSLGKTLQIRFDQVQTAMRDFEEALSGFPDTHDAEKMAHAARALSHEYNGMGMTTRERAFVTRKSGVTMPITSQSMSANAEFRALGNAKLSKMRALSKKINEITFASDQLVSQAGDDAEIYGSAFHSDTAKALAELYNGELKEFNDSLMTAMNEKFMDVEYGDIPNMRLSEAQLSLRSMTNISRETLAKKADFEQNVKRATNLQRRKFSKALTSAMQTKGKANAKEFSGDVPSPQNGTDVNSYGYHEALTEYSRQIDKDGNPSAFGKKLAGRIKRLVNTEASPVVLSDEEQLILNAWQSKSKTGGNVGRANSATIHHLAGGLALSVDGEAIRGLGATPDQAERIIKTLIRDRKAARTSKAKVETEGVDRAIIIEQAQDIGPDFENGIPQGAPFTVRRFLRAITHREAGVESNARTITARLARLNGILPESVDTPSFAGFRKAVRAAGAALEKSDDISGAIRFVSESLYGSNTVSHALRSAIEPFAQALGREPADVFSELVTEATDTLSNKALIKQFSKSVAPDVAGDVLEEIEVNVLDGVAYVTNGMISSRGARQRHYALGIYEDMLASDNATKGSTRSIFSDDVPAEYAFDHAHEVIDGMTPASRAAIDDFTGGNPQPFFYTGMSDGPLGRGIYVAERPTNTIDTMADAVVASVGEAKRDQVRSLVEQLAEVRSKVNAARLDPKSSEAAIDRLYTLDGVIVDELTKLGAVLDTNAKAVVVRDTNPAIFSGQLTKVSPITKAIHGHFVRRVAEGLSGDAEAKAIEAMRGVYTPSQMVEFLTDIVGGPRQLRDTLRDMGYTSVNLGEHKMMLEGKNARGLRSEMFEEAAPILGENGGIPAINGQIMDALQAGTDPIKVFSQAASHLEAAGVPPKTLDAMMALSRGRRLPSDVALEIRSSNKWNPLRTNASIMRRSGLAYLADFFIPEAGGGGHFERTNASMGKFVVPLTTMLRRLPDADGIAMHYWNTGPRMMADSVMGSLGMTPRRRMTQPTSHMNIISALRNADEAAYLPPQHRRVYDHIRSYLDQATTRLREIGGVVGDIDRNYFPQVWRKDLIEADPDKFRARLTKFLVTSTNANGADGLTSAMADEAAGRIVQKIIDEDGVFSNPTHMLKRTGKSGNSDHLDFSRMLRLDQFPEFTNFDNPDSLAPFLENDLLVAMTKYSDNLEHRIDITRQFGAGAHGYHDYIAILSDPMHGRDVIGKLLSSNEVIRSNWSRYNGAAEGKMGAELSSTLFFAPIKDAHEAARMADTLIEKARSGASKQEIEAEIMSLLDPQLVNTPNAAQLRMNFQKRATAISAALSDTKGLTKLTSQKNLGHANGFLNAAMRKPIDGLDPTYSLKTASKWLRSFNAVTLLGFTTLTSFGDAVLPLIRSGDFAAYSKALKSYATNPVYRDMIRNIGAATENAVHQRLTVAHGTNSTQLMTGFFNTTLLTPWTDMMRNVASAVAHEHFKAQHRILREQAGTRAGRIARRILNEAGLGDLVDDPSLDFDLIMETVGSANEHPLRAKIAAANLRLTNEMVFSPNPNDTPLWAQTPTGAIVWQLKSYPMMMSRLIHSTLGEAFAGNGAADRAANFAKALVGQSDNRLAPLAALLVAGPAAGSLAVAAKDVIQGRGGEDNREFALRDRRLSKTGTDAFKDDETLDLVLGWYRDGMIAMGGLGLLGEMMYNIAAQTDNGAYGTNRVWEIVLGPSVGIFNDAMTVTQGAQSAISGDEANGVRRAAAREVVGRIPILGGVSWAKEGIVDMVAGERSAGTSSGEPQSSGYGSGYGGGYGSGYDGGY